MYENGQFAFSVFDMVSLTRKQAAADLINCGSDFVYVELKKWCLVVCIFLSLETNYCFVMFVA